MKIKPRLRRGCFLAIRRLKHDHPDAYRRYLAAGRVVKPQPLPPCPTYADKLCPGECQYILSAATCIHDLGMSDADLFADLDALAFVGSDAMIANVPPRILQRALDVFKRLAIVGWSVPVMH
ncbi:MAG: hypothetical protein ABSC06_34580 [Rhodopila sp.]